MKVARFYAPGDIRIEDVPEPSPGPNEVKIRVRNCSTCGTDVKIYKSGHQNIDPPRIMGHEIAGEVVEIGADVGPPSDGQRWRVGDRVQVIAAVPDGTCPDCLRGWMTICPNQTSIGYQYEGGFAEYLIVPEQVLKVDGLNRIPDGVGFDEASVAEPFACAINAQELARVGPGDDVAGLADDEADPRLPDPMPEAAIADPLGVSQRHLVDEQGHQRQAGDDGDPEPGKRPAPVTAHQPGRLERDREDREVVRRQGQRREHPPEHQFPSPPRRAVAYAPIWTY